MRSVWLTSVLVVAGALLLTLLPTPAPVEAGGTNIVVLGGSSAVSDSVLAELATCTSGSVSRIAGANRYATAAAVSSAFLKPGVDFAYVATGENFPDALAGSAAAGAGAGGPVLLVRPASIPSETAAELSRLKPKTIVVLGGTAAISAGVESALGAYGTVVRVAGSDRYSTGALVSNYAFPAGASTAYVATGTNFPDALAGGPAAVLAKGPVLLVDPNNIPSSVGNELTRLGLSTIKVLGGTAAVSASVEAELKAYAPSVVRLAGPNRYATAAVVSKNTFSPGVGTIFIATGTNFPDALAGGPVAGILGGPILLTDTDSIPSATKNEIQRLTGTSCPTLPTEKLVFKQSDNLSVMLTDGTVKPLTDGNSLDWQPKWHPSGQNVLFYRDDLASGGLKDGLYVVNREGPSNPQRILNDRYASEGDYAPGGTRIVFVSTRISASNPASACGDGPFDQLFCDSNLFIYNLITGSIQQLTFLAANNWEVAWSPDGSMIAFTSDLDNDWEIFTINVNGTGLTQRTFNNEGDGSAAWLPDSKGIVYRGYIDGQSEIWSMRFGSPEVRLTNNPARDDYPAVASDGTIAFARGSSVFNMNIFTMTATGGNQTNTGTRGYMPDWRSSSTR